MLVKEKTIDENIKILKRELTYKNDESLKQLLQLIEHITVLSLNKKITLDACEKYTYTLFALYEELEPL